MAKRETVTLVLDLESLITEMVMGSAEAFLVRLPKLGRTVTIMAMVMVE